MGQLDMRCLETGHLCDRFGRHIWLPWASPELVVVNKEKLALVDQVLMLWADCRGCRSAFYCYAWPGRCAFVKSLT